MQAGRGMVVDAGQHVGEPGARVDLVQLGGARDLIPVVATADSDVIPGAAGV